MAVINLASKYSEKLDERFKLSSRTDEYTGKDYDFTGVNTINIYSIDGTDLNNYDRTASTDRFGTTTEVGDTKQTMVLSKDQGFSRAIDYGNAQEQYNIKRAQMVLKSIWDETMVPTIDKYRFTNWVNGAGLGVVNSTALAVGTVIEAIMTGSAALSNKLVPLANRVIFIKESVYIKCKLATEIIGIDTLGAESVKNGKVGYLDGMPVIRVPDSYFPTGINFLIKYKGATVDPVTLKTLRVQKAPKGYDADILEGRMIYDSFVLGQKVNGLYVHAQSAMLAAPTLTNTSNVITFACTNSTGIKYTVDGTNPKNSSTSTTVLAAAYTSGAPTLTSGQTLRAYAYATSGYTNSPISETTYA